MSMTGKKVDQADIPGLGGRHITSGLNTRFLDSHLPFSDYVAHMRDIIVQARVGYPDIDMARIVEGNAPFELSPISGYLIGNETQYRRGIVLVHGLTDSPYFMRHLAAFLQESGFRVLAVLLPGHGTRPGDLLDVEWHDWAKVVAYAVNQLALEAEEIYLGGYSAGAALSVFHSLQDTRIKGLFLFAPALKISNKAVFAGLHKFYSWLMPSAKWLSICPDADIYKYESFPKNAAAQMYALTRALRSRLRVSKMELPVFAVASQDDTTVDTAATVAFMAQARNPANKLVYYFSDAENLPTASPNFVMEKVNGVFPELNIVSAAHTAIVLPREDTYYGNHGEYRNCLHYLDSDRARFGECLYGGDEIKKGEITVQNLAAGTTCRLMYNPNFAALLSSMRQFIASLPD